MILLFSIKCVIIQPYVQKRKEMAMVIAAWSKPEQAAYTNFADSVTREIGGGPSSNEPTIVAMMGSVGSGKTTVSHAFEDRGFARVCADDCRVALRAQGAGYDHANDMVEILAGGLLARGHAVVIDSDNSKDYKRAALEQLAEKASVKIYFVDVHVSNLDVLIHRTMSSNNLLFAGASTHRSIPEEAGACTVALREMIRQIPHHYDWSADGGGKWLRRERPNDLLVDTLDETAWRETVQDFVAKKVS